MSINQIKDKRQWESIAKWEASKSIAIVEAYTGFGKTEIGSKILSKSPNDIIVAVVPRTVLKEQLLKKFYNIPNFHCYVINTFTMSESLDIIRECDILWVDEVHWCLGQDSKYFSTLLDTVKYKKFLGTTATLDKEKKDFLRSKGIGICDTISIAEGIRLGIVPSFFMYNVPVHFSDKEKIIAKKLDRWYNNCYKLFDFDYNLANKCMSKVTPRWLSNWIDSPQAQIARQYGWNGCTLEQAINNHRHNLQIEKGVIEGKKIPVYGKPEIGDKFHPEKIKQAAFVWNMAMHKRKSLYGKTQSKVDAAMEVLSLLKRKSMVFSYTQEQANNMVTAMLSLGRQALAYHTGITPKVRKENLLVYTKSDPKENMILSTCKAINEGVDIKDASLGLQCGYDSTKRVYTQRAGRLLRVDEENPNKVSLFISLYTDDFELDGEKVLSQEKKSLMYSQKGQLNVKWLDSIDHLREEIKDQLL